MPPSPYPFGPFTQPLPGTEAYNQQQAGADCRDMAFIARRLRTVALEITPFINRLSCHSMPLCVLECQPTLLAMAEEIEQSDIPAREQRIT